MTEDLRAPMTEDERAGRGEAARSPSRRHALWFGVAAAGAALIAGAIVAGWGAASPPIDAEANPSAAPSADQLAEQMQGCRLATSIQGISEQNAKAVGTREGASGPEVRAQWGWYADDGADLALSDPSHTPASYATDVWLGLEQVQGFTCDGTTWEWMKQ